MQQHSSYQQDNSELLVKYIAGEALPEEAMAVEEWIQASADNRSQYETLVATWNASGISTVVYQTPNVEQEWVAFKTAVAQAPVKKMQRKPAFTYMVAASIVLLAGLMGWFLINQERTTIENEVLVQSAQTILYKDLPDGTKLVLDANSAVTYSSDFNKATRRIVLNGEGFFKVTPNPQKPFVIEMDGVKLQVLGTSFRVQNDRVKQRVKVEVATGRVMLYNETDTLVLVAGQSGMYDRKEKQLEQLAVVDVNNFSYATKQFSFNDLPLAMVAKHLEKTYGVKISFKNTAITTCRLSAQFDQQPLKDILEVIASTFGITYEIKGKTIVIDGKGCE